MIRLFAKSDKEEIDSHSSRLRSLEWKVNLLLILVGIQLLVTSLTFARDLLMPSTATIVIVTVVLVAIGWVFRKQIPGLIKRMVARQILKEESSVKDSSHAGMDESIR